MIKYYIIKAEEINQKIQQTKEKRKSQVLTVIQCQCKLQNLSDTKFRLF